MNHNPELPSPKPFGLLTACRLLGQLCSVDGSPEAPGDAAKPDDKTRIELCAIWRFPTESLFGGPHNKDYTILGSILEPPYLGKLPYAPAYVPAIP